jgi:hypothetical protein
MNKELQDYYEYRFDMFSRQGWKDLIEDIDARIKAIESIHGVKSIEVLFTRQGELDALNWLKTLPEVSREVYEQLEKENP